MSYIEGVAHVCLRRMRVTFFFSSVHCISFFRILFVWNKIIVIEKNITHLRRMWRNFVDGVVLRHTLSSETCDFFTAFSWIIIIKKGGWERLQNIFQLINCRGFVFYFLFCNYDMSVLKLVMHIIIVIF